MDQRDSGAIGRPETKAAIVWAEVEEERQAVEERTARLRAARLARDAQRNG